uniref:HAT C-terminal dimerisation domain-containing protein n=1 Tax=Amphimedon queenslandica TaxID=400682 RepID=A0A1X7V7A3_AMPQE
MQSRKGNTWLKLFANESLLNITSDIQLYPNIKVLVTILCNLPVTSCTDKTSFSGLKGTKSSLRSTMTKERLSSLALLHIHRDIPVNIKAVIDKFETRHRRCLQL